MKITRHVRARQEGDTEAVAPIELFFDLVFVFALTQVTYQMSSDMTPHGLLRGVLVFALLWWSWTAYAWLGNVVNPNDSWVRIVMFIAMTAMFILALTIPEAFNDLPGGLDGPVVVAVCYFLFRLLHIVMFLIASNEDKGLRRQVMKFIPSMLGGTTLLLVASQLHGHAQTAVWAAALMADYLGNYVAGASGWRIKSAAHFAERHGLILIVALGESIVAIGVGVAKIPISTAIVVISICGIALAAALWWLYFQSTAPTGEHALKGIDDRNRARLARDAFSYLHFPIVGSVVLIALGLKKVLEHGSEHGPLFNDPLTGPELFALCGGVAIYLLGQVAFSYKVGEGVDPLRIVIAMLVCAVGFVGLGISAPATLFVTTLIVGTSIFIESSRVSRVNL